MKFVTGVLCSISLSFLPVFAQSITVSQGEAEAIGAKIFKNECGSKASCLTSWNNGEGFASVGIGHFIWYPADKEGPFHESFPGFLSFADTSHAGLPDWLTPETDCPWNSRDDFKRELMSEKMITLRKFLKQTIPLQARFMIRRLRSALPGIIAASDIGTRDLIRQKINLIVRQPAGIYALTDSVNFKGEGLLETERYNGQGWGLLQVLQEMKIPGHHEHGLDNFATAAERVLYKRVQNSPPERNEARWLPGWRKRILTYTEPIK